MKHLPKEYHDLREYAIGYFSAKAGFIAPNMPIDEDFSDLTLINTGDSYLNTFSLPIRQIRMITVKSELCYTCSRHMNNLFPTIWFIHNWHDANCQLCGIEVDDDIPF